MAITNIEIAAMAPKAQTVTQIKQPELQRPMVEQANLSHEFTKEIKHNASQPVKTIKSENSEYRYDAKNKGNGEYHNSKKQGKNNQESQEKKSSKSRYNTNRPGSIDIKI